MSKQEKLIKKYTDHKITELVNLVADKDKLIEALEASVKRKDEIIDRLTDKQIPEKED